MSDQGLFEVDAAPVVPRPPKPTVYPRGADVRRGAHISDDGRYRYGLIRRWGDGTAATFVMLNPSTADGEQDDPTIRRCVGFARALGCDALLVVNLYAWRATKPEDLWTAEDPVGPENDYRLERHIRAAASADRPLVAAWGANAREDRVRAVIAMRGADRLTALGVTKDGAPRHPLYLPASARPTPWRLP